MGVILTLVDTKQETADVASCLFTGEASFTWQAGQFLQYTLPHLNPDDRKTTRYFTIASAPFEQRVTLTTRFATERRSSFKRALRELPIGAVVEAEGPSGNFVVKAPEVDRVFIAGDIGITPYRAILLDLDHRARSVNVTLLYANRSPDVVYKGELAKPQRRTEPHRFLAVRFPAGSAQGVNLDDHRGARGTQAAAAQPRYDSARAGGSETRSGAIPAGVSLRSVLRGGTSGKEGAEMPKRAPIVYSGWADRQVRERAARLAA